MVNCIIGITTILHIVKRFAIQLRRTFVRIALTDAIAKVNLKW